MAKVVRKKKVKRIPPPLVPLPLHLLPKRLVIDLHLDPPMQALVNKKENELTARNGKGDHI